MMTTILWDVMQLRHLLVGTGKSNCAYIALLHCRTQHAEAQSSIRKQEILGSN